MDLEGAKENIQPLQSGRNIQQLEIALNAESHQDLQHLLLQKRGEYELAITNYFGDDPLDPWYEYILWVEQSYPKSGSESALDKLVLKCLTHFEDDKRYNQDRRMIKLYIKYIDTQPNPVHYYQILYNQGIGTMVADLYIGWAHYYDALDNFEKAESVYRKGIDARAQPFNILDQSHKQFYFSMSQRILHKDEGTREQFLSAMEEQRHALTSLKSHDNRHVGSVRTGTAIYSHVPGTVQQSGRSTGILKSKNIKIFADENQNAAEQSTESEKPLSVVQSIVKITKQQENMREPGPWSHAKQNDDSTPVNNRSLFPSPNNQCNPKFEILEDEKQQEPLPDDLGPKTFHLGIQLPPNFVRQNDPMTECHYPLNIDQPAATHFPQYDKIMCFPNANEWFSPEELRAYRCFKRRNTTNPFTNRMDKIWSTGYGIPIRLPPMFARKNDIQTSFDCERVIPLTEDEMIGKKFTFNVSEHYPADRDEEISFEELMKLKWLNKQLESQKRAAAEQTITDEMGLDETCVVGGRLSLAAGATRKSIVPGGRKSIMPPKIDQTLNQTFKPIDNEMKSAPGVTRKSIVRGGRIPKTELLSESINPKGDKMRPVVAQLSQTSGAIKKSIVPPKTDQTLMSDSIKQMDDETRWGFASRSVVQPPVTEKCLKLFTDSESVFKKPELPTIASNRLSIYSKNKHFPDELETTVSQSNNPDNGSIFANETCTTQTFNLFLQAQSVSTPIKSKVNAEVLMVQESEFNESPESQPDMMAFPKQLSTILETTESHTLLSRTGSTKSSNGVTSLIESSTCPTLQSQSPPAIVQAIQTEGMMGKVSDAGILTTISEEPIVKSIENCPFNIYVDEVDDTKINQTEMEEIIFPKMNIPIPITIYEDETELMPEDIFKKPSDSHTKPLRKSIVELKLNETNQTETIPIIIEDQRTDPILPSIRLDDKTLINQSGRHQHQQSQNFIQIDKPTGTIRNISMKNPLFCIYTDSDREPTEPILPSIRLGDKTVINQSERHRQQQSQNDIQIDDPTETIPIPSFCIHTDTDREPTVPILPSIRLDDKTLMNPSNRSIYMGEREATFTSFSMATPPENDPARNDTIIDEFTASPFPIVKNRLPNVYHSEPLQSKIPRPRKNPSPPQIMYNNSLQQFQEKSIHIKAEPIRESGPKILNVYSIEPTEPTHKQMDRNEADLSVSMTEYERELISNIGSTNSNRPSLNISMTDNEREHLQSIYGTTDTVPNAIVPVDYNSDQNDQNPCGLSIYVKRSPIEKLPTGRSADDEMLPSDDNDYQFPIVNLNETKQFIDDFMKDRRIIDPFDNELRISLLQAIDFEGYISVNNQLNCVMMNRIGSLKLGKIIEGNGRSFTIGKLIGHGAYGHVFAGKCNETGKLLAFKQERPSNLWEYYICFEVEARLYARNINMLPAFMTIDYAFIGNSCSIFVSELSAYGTMIDVCNRYKEATQKNIDEYLVMCFTIQMLTIIDHLHSINIIHADIKPDNFLMMDKLSENVDTITLKLIDFGEAIDMRRFRNGQKFNRTIKTENFTCVEMMENKPWTYQTDLYCLAGVIHCMLFGRYMVVDKKPTGLYGIREHIPRYFNRDIWEIVFEQLINIRDCESMPNLQRLRTMLKEEVTLKSKYVSDKIVQFNNIF